MDEIVYVVTAEDIHGHRDVDSVWSDRLAANARAVEIKTDSDVWFKPRVYALTMNRRRGG